MTARQAVFWAGVLIGGVALYMWGVRAVLALAVEVFFP